MTPFLARCAFGVIFGWLVLSGCGGASPGNDDRDGGPPDAQPPSPCSLAPDGRPYWRSPTHAAATLDFVRVESRADVPVFAVGECKFSFVAVNAYYLQEEAARERTGPKGRVDETLDKLAGLGAAVVRTWGFNDDPTKDTAMQRAPLVYDEANLAALDTVIAKAKTRGLYVILPLVNNWNAYGGTRQYVAWQGLPSPREGDPRFFTDPGVRQHFRAHLANLVQRVNTVTGIAYRDEPAIFAWELGNELRGSGLADGGAAMRAWVDEMAGTIRGLDDRHLIATGEEGLDNAFDEYDRAFWGGVSTWMFQADTSFRANLESPYIDFATAHVFPESWGWHPPQIGTAVTRWMEEHAAIAKARGKPFLLEEFGLINREVVSAGQFTLSERRALYGEWMDTGLRIPVPGLGLWMFSYDARPDDWDQYTFYWKTGTEPEDPRNRYADLVRTYAERFAAP